MMADTKFGSIEEEGEAMAAAAAAAAMATTAAHGLSSLVSPNITMTTQGQRTLTVPAGNQSQQNLPSSTSGQILANTQLPQPQPSVSGSQPD